MPVGGSLDSLLSVVGHLDVGMTEGKQDFMVTFNFLDTMFCLVQKLLIFL